jgi:hypothetical protein
MKLIAFLTMVILSTSLCARDDYYVSDRLLECAALYGWLSRNGTNQEKKAEFKELFATYYGSASDLSNKEYALTTLKQKAEEFKNDIYNRPKHAVTYLSRKNEICSSPENLGERVVKELNQLIQKKKNM